MLLAHAEQVGGLRTRSRVALRSALERAVDDVGHLRGRVAALSPAATLARGYAIVQTADGVVVRSPDDAPPGDVLRLRLARGDLAAWAEGPWEDGPWASGDGPDEDDPDSEFDEAEDD
jgi:exodeoxyribonuclease VII large subunit